MVSFVLLPLLVHGRNQTVDTITTKYMPSSLSDGYRHQAIELALIDKSVFAPNPATIPTGLRRSELLPKSPDRLASSVATFHFSMMQSHGRPL